MPTNGESYNQSFSMTPKTNSIQAGNKDLFGDISDLFIFAFRNLNLRQT